MALTPPEFYLVDYRGPLALPNPPNGNAVVMLEDDVKDFIHGGALLDTGILFHREVNFKDTVTQEAHEQDGNLLLDVTTLKSLHRVSLHLVRDNTPCFG